jgi:biopolymer transport protein ExbD
MRLPKAARAGALRFNLTPIIDVVFNLIIFFLAASHLARTEAVEEVTLPEAGTGGPEEAAITHRLVLTIRSPGELSVGSRPVAFAQLETILAAGRDAARKSAREFEVRIRTDQKVPYSEIEPVLLACARHGITRVRFAVVPLRGGRER